jgi:hypothetical protein
MAKTALILAWLSALSLVDCKPTPSGDKGPEGMDSSVTTATSDTSTGTPEFQCTPRTFSLGDTITLRMAIPHGEYLMVTQPSGTTFFLVYPHPEDPPDALLASSEAFTQMPMIRLAAAFKARPRVSGRDTLERVFYSPGNYVLETAHNLESERASEIHKCIVRFRP